MTRVLVVGLGTIARTHLSVLAARPDATVIAGVDPALPDADFPVFASLPDALASIGQPDLVVVATPTDTHVSLVSESLSLCGALVLSEKPLARTPSAIAGLEAQHAPGLVRDRLKVAHHFAFSPEVEWARAYVAGRALGVPTRVQAVFNDAYTSPSAAQRASLVSPWVDSAPNQLSIVAAFVSGLTLASHAARPDRAVTMLEHDGGRTSLSSNWLAADSSKQTNLEYGETRLWLDHTSMTAVVTDGGHVVEHVAYSGSASRKDAHYLGLYDALLSDASDPRLGVDLATRIAALIDEAEQLPPTGVTWSEVPARAGD
jgi:predicted dehydrogenase